MRKYLYDYIKQVDDNIKSNKCDNKMLKEHIIKISFFQHERFIHLIVTLFYAFLVLAFLLLGMLHWSFFLIDLILMIFLVFYIIHYFALENGVQYLYKQYDAIVNKI